MTSAFQPVHLNLERKQRSYTLEEYLRKEAKSVEKYEFINGKIVKMPYARGPHNIICINIAAEIRFAFKQKTTNYYVYGSDQKIYFPALDEGVYADSLAVCEKPLYWDDNDLLLINPMLVVGVLSKSTSKYDRTSKFDKYKTLESFKEYVLIEQNKCYAEVWYREKPGLWHETIVTDINGLLPLQSVDVQIEMKEIYRNINL